ncbi:MAG: carboxypeptidase-like regulatory domain-containing protein [Planctomycetes bacterium]|nr:carboxypeptidase-like regulatory domain-containing protein [Planctomycetota bacterium]
MRARGSLVALGLLLFAIGASAWFAARRATAPRAADLADAAGGAERAAFARSIASEASALASATEPGARHAIQATAREEASVVEVVAAVAAPLLVAGRVLDELGAPIGGVELELECLDPARRKFTARSDDRGHYRLHGDQPPFGGLLRAAKPGYAPHVELLEALPIEPGEHVLVLLRGASLRGRLMVDPELAMDRFELVLATHRSGFRATPTETGEFAFVDLPVGYAELGVQDHGRTVHWLEGLTLVSGASTDDPRLDPLDLRGRLRAWSVRLVRSDGAPFSATEVGVSWSLATLQGAWSERTDADGRLAALLPSDVERVWLGIEGFQDPWASPDASELVVLPMPIVRFGVDANVQEFAGRVRLELTFLDPPPPGGVSARRASLAEDGTAEVVLDCAGRYQVGWSPLALGSATLSWPEHVIAVRSAPSEQFFELTLDLAQLASLREAVGS